MKLSYTDTDQCPVSIELTVVDLKRLVIMTKGSDITGGARIHAELQDAYRDAVQGGERSFAYDIRFRLKELGIESDVKD